MNNEKKAEIALGINSPKDDYTELETNLKVWFTNREVLVQALTHPSFLEVNPIWILGHNEHLAILGHEILSLVITEYLLRQFSKKPGDDIDYLRMSLLNQRTMAGRAAKLGLHQFILVSPKVMDDASRESRIFSQTFKAVVAAIYLDQGLLITREFIRKNFLHTAIVSQILRDTQGHPSYILERAAKSVGLKPYYEFEENKDATDPNDCFVVKVYFGKELVAESKGESRGRAKYAAAEAALLTKGWKKKKENKEDILMGV